MGPLLGGPLTAYDRLIEDLLDKLPFLSTLFTAALAILPTATLAPTLRGFPLAWEALAAWCVQGMGDDADGERWTGVVVGVLEWLQGSLWPHCLQHNPLSTHTLLFLGTLLEHRAQLPTPATPILAALLDDLLLDDKVLGPVLRHTREPDQAAVVLWVLRMAVAAEPSYADHVAGILVAHPHLSHLHTTGE